MPIWCTSAIQTNERERNPSQIRSYRTIEGIFLIVFLQPGCPYSGDVFVAALEDFAENRQVKIHRIKDKDVIWPQNDMFEFPIAEARKVQLKDKLREALKDIQLEHEIEDTNENDVAEPEEPSVLDGGILWTSLKLNLLF